MRTRSFYLGIDDFGALVHIWYFLETLIFERFALLIAFAIFAPFGLGMVWFKVTLLLTKERQQQKTKFSVKNGKKWESYDDDNI